jgi:hypothetical protein
MDTMLLRRLRNGRVVWLLILISFLILGDWASAQSPIVGQGLANHRVMGFQGCSYCHTFALNAYTGNENFNLLSSPFGFDWTAPNISDFNGNLLFYSNGGIIGLLDSTIMNNGDSVGILSDNPFWSFYPAHYNRGFGFLVHGGFFLPHPNDSLKWDYFSSPQHFIPNFTDNPLNVYHSIVEKDSLGNFGVILKNNSILQDTLSGTISACKHANGRDWWVINVAFNQAFYYAHLLTPDSIYSYQFPLDGPACSQGGQHVFSASGKYFSMINGNCKIRVYEFDRCTGQLFNLRFIPQLESNTWYFSSAFSWNEKYLYFCNLDKCFQLDLENPNLQAAISLIHDKSDTIYYDPVNFFPTNFLFTVPSNDGRIYIEGTSTVSLFSWIDNPDTTWNEVGFHPMEGLHQRANSMTATYHPNYFLGPEVGTICDSLGIVTGKYSPVPLSTKIFPNPAQDIVVVQFEPPREKPGRLYLMSTEGRILKELRLPQWTTQQNIDLKDLSAGTYFLRFYIEEKWKFEKLIVVKP